ncbi:flagellar hook-basal body complex protein [Acetobacter vaccinii]|uniref:Flagellar hook protein FlgE n=1 Tax=Acetobacter vaccinii TaxID=2592655 RepID=A0A5C1YLM1_9PROT|nr:flagellar hook-basal body complex protein [Acetobacter vaccinii]QEO16883.1 flagellar hook-basal body complex protein [Acetobacter vaccinii]
MSVFNALSTAVSGINSQSTAFTNLSNNIANSQTVGYKANTTAFQDYVAGSLTGTNAASEGISQSTSAVTVQHVDKQGTASSSTNSLSMAISGSGLFNVSKETGATTSGQTQFETQQYYTRNGEFYENKSGYLVNTSGYYLDGYMVGSDGNLSNSLTQINVADVAFRPTKTTTLTLSAEVGNLPSDNSSYTAQSYTTAPVTTYDSNATAHKVALNWTQSDTNPLVWNVSAYDADGTGTIASNSYQVTFDSSGTLASVVDNSTGKTIGSTLSGASATIPVTATYNGVQQSMTLDLGTIGGTSGTTMATATGTKSVTQANPLTASGTTLTMDDTTLLGTTTGSNQTYMTTPVSANGTEVAAKWTQTASSPPTWSVSFVNPYDTSSTSSVSSDTYNVVFNTDGSVKTVTDSTTGASTTLGALSATIGGTSYTADLSKMTLSTASSLSTDSTSLTSDSVATGNFQGVEIESDGSIMATFDNGDTQLVAKVALSNFANVNGLNAVDGQAYTATASSGTAQTGVVGANGTGTLSVGYVESSTTDLTSDLSALIVAQEAYSANTKVVTTADQLLQTTIAMKQ